jgi:hypothetical protein
MYTTDARKRNGWLKALKQELKNIIDKGILKNTTKLEANEPAALTMETRKNKLDSHRALDKLKCRIVVRGGMQKKKCHIHRAHILPSISIIHSTEDVSS